jgi:hypothetical protein
LIAIRSERVTEGYSTGGIEMLWLVVIILAVLAIGGGVALSKFLFLLLIAALVLALVGAFGGRTA